MKCEKNPRKPIPDEGRVLEMIRRSRINNIRRNGKASGKNNQLNRRVARNRKATISHEERSKLVERNQFHDSHVFSTLEQFEREGILLSHRKTVHCICLTKWIPWEKQEMARFVRRKV
jgi:hypothetical protein